MDELTTEQELEPIRSVLDVVGDAHVLTDLDGTVLVANARARQLLVGTTSALPPPLSRLTSCPQEAEELLLRWRSSASQRPATFTLASGRRVRGDGARLGRRPWLLIRLRDHTEATSAYLGVAARLRSDHLRTLSQRLDATIAELHSANRRLHNANDELQQYAGAVAHDVRTPLFTIRGFAQMLRDRDHVDEQGAELVELILESAERLHQTTESLLAVARLDDDAAAEATEAVSVAEVLGEAVADQRREIEATGATVVAAGLDEVRVAVPAVALRQVFQNLLANSLRFRAPERPLRVEVTARRTGDLVELAVTDNGTGVTDHDLDRLFDLFQRGTRRPGTPGHGIGLATCRKLVNRWGGAIRCESIDAPGARFTFTAPVDTPTGERLVP